MSPASSIELNRHLHASHVSRTGWALPRQTVCSVSLASLHVPLMTEGTTSAPALPSHLHLPSTGRAGRHRQRRAQPACMSWHVSSTIFISPCAHFQSHPIIHDLHTSTLFPSTTLISSPSTSIPTAHPQADSQIMPTSNMLSRVLIALQLIMAAVVYALPSASVATGELRGLYACNGIATTDITLRLRRPLYLRHGCQRRLCW